jgi:hypothetical protein
MNTSRSTGKQALAVLQTIDRVDQNDVILVAARTHLDSGLGTQHPSGRVSLANLNESDCRQIGRAMPKLIEEYVDRDNKDTGSKLDWHAVK